MKQILEEAAKEFVRKCSSANEVNRFNQNFDCIDVVNAFHDGAEWQKDRYNSILEQVLREVFSHSEADYIMNKFKERL